MRTFSAISLFSAEGPFHLARPTFPLGSASPLSPAALTMSRSSDILPTPRQLSLSGHEAEAE